MITSLTRWRFPLLTVVSVVTFVTGAIAGLVHDNGRIAEGIAVQGVHVGNLSPAEAIAVLQAEFDEQIPPTVAVRNEDQSWQVPASEIGLHLDYQNAVDTAYTLTRGGVALSDAAQRLQVGHEGRNIPLRVTVDRPAVEAWLGEIATELDREPVDARVRNVVGDRPVFEAERPGRRLAIVRSADAIIGNGEFPPPATADLVVDNVAARRTLDELERSFTTVLATFRTSMSQGYYGVMRENRAHNVRLCLERITGMIMEPGQEFSFNDDIGERRREDGFKSSIAFLRKRDGTIEERWTTGGGICQLATTMFNAALYANLTITQRTNHMKPVHYGGFARDATVYYGVVDLKFRNTLPRPIMMWGEVLDNYDLVIRFFGHPDDDYDVDLSVERWPLGGRLFRTVKAPDGRVIEQRRKICDTSYSEG